MAFRFSCSPRLPRRATALAATLLFSATTGHTQVTATAVDVVEVTARAPSPIVSVAGFGSAPLARSPFQALSVHRGSLQEFSVDSLSEISRLDASLGDAYNSPGYWASFRVRGYKIDPRFGMQRDGLPINGETALLMDTVDRLEVLKGISGAQAGTSAPGGLVNLVVKRPRGNHRNAWLGWTEGGSLKGSVDLSQVLDAASATAIRVNAAYEKLSPQTRSAGGERHQFAVAGHWQISHQDTLEAEAETSRQAQPSVPGFSLLGNQLPSANGVNPRVNLNNQDWSLPVVFNNTSASLRWTSVLAPGWQVVSQAMRQALRTDDRIAFPFGCSTEGHYNAYCSNGSFDLYDFRSEGERRHSDAATVHLQGEGHWMGLKHEFTTGLLWTRYTARMGSQAYNWAGVGTIDGGARISPSPEALDANTLRTETSLQWFVRDVVDLDASKRLWVGLRHSQLSRASVRTDGGQAVSYEQSFSTPWVALSWQLQPMLLAYASWGQGVESEVIPNRSFYRRSGQVLPALRSHQAEWGLKHEGNQYAWSAAYFDIVRPQAGGVSPCDGVTFASCDYGTDGQAHHRGLELSGDRRQGPWTVRGSAMWLHARRQAASNGLLNGRVPANVAQRALRLQLGHQVASIVGLNLSARVSHEGARPVDELNTQSIPSWTTLGLAARYQWRRDGRDFTFRAGLDNALNRRAWKESPFQYEHVYLYPLEPRTAQISLQVSL